MTPDEINNAVTIIEKNNQYIVQIQIKLFDNKDNHQRCVLEKASSRIVRTGQPTTLCVWPNFASTDWPYYYMFFALNPKESIKPVAVVSVNGARDAVGAPLERQRVVQARSLSESLRKHSERKRIKQSPSEFVALDRLLQSPEAIICEAPVPRDNGGRTQEPAASIVGLILFPALREPARRAETWRVGIDFGSTNTSVYYAASDDGITRPMRFGNRAVSPFVGTREGAGLQQALEFLPQDSIDIPFLTILASRQSEQKEEERPLWSDRIYYVPDVVNMAERLVSPSREVDDLLFDLKWGKEEHVLRKVRVFLSQVVLQSLAEAAALGIAVNQVRWLFSYPQEAFDADRREQFERLCPRAVILAVGGDASAPRPAVKFDSESLCTARYFASANKASLLKAFSPSISVGQPQMFCCARASAGYGARLSSMLAARLSSITSMQIRSKAYAVASGAISILSLAGCRRAPMARS